mgnify:CR=1 FL=1
MNETILIVDDEESICRSLEGILSDEGYEVLTAKSGEEALKTIEEEQPDLILLDIWLPGIDGIDVLKNVKQEHPQIQVIMMSGHATIETAVEATRIGAMDFLEKPMALSIEECDEMIAAAEANDRLLFIAQCIRFWPAYEKLAEMIKSGEFGKVVSAKFTRLSPTPTWSQDNWLMDTSLSGGALTDLHVHDVDFIISEPGVWGIGNGLLQDILLAAKIHPRCRAVDLTKAQRRALHRAIVKTIESAVKLGGRSDEHDLFGNTGSPVYYDDISLAEPPPPVCSLPSDIPWASVDPISGTVPGGESTSVAITLDSTGLTVGNTYSGNLCVESNDPDNDLVVVPLALTVELGDAEISVDAALA